MALVLVVVPTAAAVCSEPRPLRVCAEFFNSDAVFVGTVGRARQTPPQGKWLDGWTYRLRVKRVFRGPRSEFIDVFTENSSARLPLDMGREYLLFASRQLGRLVIGDCGNSGLTSKAEGTITQIERILDAGPGGEVSGRIVEQVSGGRGLRGIRILVRGTTGTYVGLTGAEGWFHIRVPAGTYSVRTESRDWLISAFDLSYDNPKRVVVHDGGCAQMLFLAYRIK